MASTRSLKNKNSYVHKKVDNENRFFLYVIFHSAFSFIGNIFDDK